MPVTLISASWQRKSGAKTDGKMKKSGGCKRKSLSNAAAGDSHPRLKLHRKIKGITTSRA
jgi:hypothetical protein